MSADRSIDLLRGYRRAVESFGREGELNQATGVRSATTAGAPVFTLNAFMSGYDGSDTTLPFTTDVSIVGGDDIVTA